METKEDYCLVYVTAKDEAEAKLLGRGLLERKLAACVNIFPKMHSIYWWQGKIDSSDEVVLIVKTSAGNYKAVESEILKNHSYETPCVLRLGIETGSKNYLKWLSESMV